MLRIPSFCLLLAICAATSRPASASEALQRLSAELVEQALSQPEVLRRLEELHLESNSEPQASAVAPMIELAASDEDRHRIFGVDGRLGIPQGLGVEVSATIIAPITVSVALDTSYFAYSVSAEATVHLLRIFKDARWSPLLAVNVGQIRFNSKGGEMIQARYPELARRGVSVSTDGLLLHAIGVTGGVDYLSSGGFHFSVEAGRLLQVGDSRFKDDEGSFMLQGWSSYIFTATAGYRF